MLATAQPKAFIPTVKRDEARAFYRDIIGLKLVHEDQFALEFEMHGMPLRVTPVQEFTPYPFTVFGWNVPKIAEAAQGLQELGVAFERYGFLEQNALGIWTSPSGAQVAWFKDPDGNLLSLTELP